MEKGRSGITRVLELLLRKAPAISLDDSSRVVIFSDLHIGDGGRSDDFLHNAHLFETLLEEYYLKESFSLVLNGDIEELMKFSCASIANAWKGLYDLFLRFRQSGFFWKIYGNHDIGLIEEKAYPLQPWLVESLAFRYGNDTLLLFHGHQASPFLKTPFSIIGGPLSYFLRYIAKPAGIRNYSVSYKSRRRYAIEKAVYEFSNRAGIISIIGHTHRPLFESLSKVDALNYRIEELCRGYPSADRGRRLMIEQEIRQLKEELDGCYHKGLRKSLRSGRYGNITIPSIFNSGCAIGKRGITAIEIDEGKIRLVYWHNGRLAGSVPHEGRDWQELGSSGYTRVVLNEDRLDYVFSRIRLLANPGHRKAQTILPTPLGECPTFT
ncbi:MAG: metallophosphoesterase [Chlorobiaceae bacterium]|nr:metallophosphoesterase [Chlorobiaceae bacterium]